MARHRTLPLPTEFSSTPGANSIIRSTRYAEFLSRLFPNRDYGILTTPDGREVYFHPNSVLHDVFERLRIGTEVTFSEEEGVEGPQASTVKPFRINPAAWRHRIRRAELPTSGVPARLRHCGPLLVEGD